MKAKILLADDDEEVLAALERSAGDRWSQDIPELFRLSYSTGSGSFVLDEVCQFLQVALRALILPNLTRLI